MNITEIMTSNVITVAPQDMISTAIKIMSDLRIGFVVVAQKNKPIGVITEGDVVCMALQEATPSNTPVSQFMASPVFTVAQDSSVFHAYDELVIRKIRHLVVEDEQGFLTGVVTMSNFISGLGVEHFTQLQEIHEIMLADPMTVDESTPITEVLRLMGQYKHAMIAVRDGFPTGIITSRDFIRLMDGSEYLPEVTMADVMTKPVITMQSSAFVPEANILMRESKLRHMVVVDKQGHIDGLLTISNVARSIEGKYVEFMRAVVNNLEHDLKSANSQYSALFERNPNTVISFNQQGEIIDINPSGVLLTGYNRDDVLGRHLSELLLTEEYEMVMKVFSRVAQGRAENIHICLRSHAEEIIYVFVSFVPVITEGIQQGVFAVVHDITERTLAERRLRKLSQALEQADEAIVIIDSKGVIEFANSAIEKLSGHDIADLIGAPQMKLGRLEQSFLSEIWDTVREGLVWKGEIVQKRKDGQEYPARVSCSPIRASDGAVTHMVSIYEDMTERKALETQLMQSQKMESIGTLVGGIAHDFNNYLTSVIGNLYLLKKIVAHEPDIESKIASIEKESYRAASMIQQLLTFARKDAVIMEGFSLSELLSDTMDLSQIAIGKFARVNWNISNERLEIHGSDTQVQQLLLNLINNSRDAVEGVEDAEVNVRLEKYQADDAFRIKYPDCSHRSFARITVSDNGCGIERDQLSKVYDPFYTTKETGKGTGLGLAMVYGAIQSHDGLIDIVSGLGKGTTITIFLPLLQHSMQEQKTEELDTETGHGEYILLVDDDSAVRLVAREILESQGYFVIEAEDGLAAIALYRANKQKIKAVLLDIVMPSLGGIKVAEKLRELTPELPIVFVSGYNQEDRQSTIDTDWSKTSWLTKPYHPEQLATEINKLLSNDISRSL